MTTKENVGTLTVKGNLLMFYLYNKQINKKAINK